MSLEFYVVNAFVVPDRPFSGNPAAVVVLPPKFNLTDQIKQNIATQFNLSETVYVEQDQNDHWAIRWFTPKEEVKLCGHATVAASFILFTKLNVGKLIKYKSIYQEKLEANFEDGSVLLDFPNNDCQKIDSNWLNSIKQAVVGADNIDRIIDVQYSPGSRKLLIRLKDDDSIDFLLQIQPDFQGLLGIDTGNVVRGVIVTQKPIKFESIHFWSRYFAPWVGIPEDPVTGSAHTVLTPFWSRVYQTEHGKHIEEFHCLQVSKRQGLLKCRLSNDGTRVLIKGQAKIFCHGTISEEELK